MKHEYINSIGVILGLCLGAVTAWHQFGPQKDTIMLTTEHRVDVGAKLEIEPIGTLSLTTGENQPVLGPVTWKIRADNPTDRAISLVSFKAFLLTEDGSPVYYSTMREQLSPLDAPLSILRLPENIPPHESRAYLISLFVPYVSDEDTRNKCDENAIKLRVIERCFFKKGRDIFGNKMKYRDIEGGNFVATMEEPFEGPKFAVIFETADGSKFVTQLSFLPGGL